MKDTTDKTFAMEYIISELLENDDIIEKKQEFSNLVDGVINSNKIRFNDMLDEVISFNGQTRVGDVISTSNVKEYKKIVKINANDIKNKLGSGQRMQFILSLVKNSSKTHIFLDEPEKHSHPSLLNFTAKIIRELSSTKDIYIATHSPKLIEMLDFDMNDIEVYNDPSFNGYKQIDLNIAANSLPNNINLVDLGEKSRTYYNAIQLEKNIKEVHLRDFMEAIFSKKIYIVEGINDELFLKKILIENNRQYEDYFIFRCFGKQHFLPFIKIFTDLGLDIVAVFDEDNPNSPTHQSINTELENHNHYKFTPNIESEIGYQGNKSNTIDYLNFLDNNQFGTTYNI